MRVQARVVLAPLVAACLWGAPANAAVPVSYSDFGPGNTFHTGLDGWCVSGATSPYCTSLHTRVIAVPIVPQGNLTLTQIVLALDYGDGTNAANITLVNDVTGYPGNVVLKSWNVSNLPVYSSPGVITLNSTGVTLTGGVRYWLVASAPDTSTTLIWFTNTLGLNGGETSIDGGPFSFLSPLPALYGGDSLPAYAIFGTQPSANGPSAGCHGSNPQVCAPFLPPLEPNSGLNYGAVNVATSAPPNCMSGDPVNCATGNLSETLTDLFIPGRGRALTWTRTYNSQLAASAVGPGPLGYGWTDSYAESLASDGSGDEIVTLGNGASVMFTPSGPGYTAASYVNATLLKNNDGSFTFTLKNARADVFNASGQLIRQTDRHGYVTTLNYDSLGNLLSIIDPAGRQLAVTTGNGLVTGLRDPMGRTVSYAYDANDNLTSVTDVAGNITRYAYDTSHQLIGVTDPLNHVTTNTYDAANRVIQQVTAAGRTTAYAYSTISTNSATTITLGDGNQVQEQFNPTGQLLSLTRGFATPGALTWTFAYDPATLARTRIADPAGDTTTATYDTHGNVLTRTDPLGRTTTYTYNSFNDPLTITNALGITTTLVYDTHGTLLSVSRPLNNLTAAIVTYSHTDNYPGDITAITDPTGRTWRYSYDPLGNLIQATDPAGDTASSAFNLDGWLLSTRTPLGEETDFSRDPYGAVTSIVGPLGDRTTYAYDSAHNLTTVTNADNHTTRFNYDSDNLPIKIVQPDGTTLQTAYNGAALTISQIDGLGQVTGYAYDALERFASSTDPLGRTASISYDAASRPHLRIDPQVTTTFNYDAASELTGVSYSDGTPAATFAYDPLGRRTAMTDGTGVSTFQFDNLNRLTGNTDACGKHVGYSYDLSGRLLSLAYPSGGSVTRAYDVAGRLSGIADFSGQTTRFSYDADSRLTQRSYPNGIDTRFAYDLENRLSQIQDPLYSAQYRRDPMGLITGQTGVDNQTYSYNSLNQLVSDNGQPFSYDAAPELTRLSGATLTYDAAGELTSATAGLSIPGFLPPASFQYDARGDRTRATLGPLAATFTYDGARRLTGFAGIATYAYSGDGLRTSKKVFGQTQNFVWDRADGLPLILDDGVNRYIYGPGAVPIEQIGSDGRAYFFHQDQIGSTRALSDAHGNPAAAFSYGAYGAQPILGFWNGNPGNPLPAATPFGYAGQYTDSESGLVAMGARFYDPLTGQFLTRDPLEALTRQPYEYAAGNPVNFRDPSGLYEGGASSGLPFLNPPTPSDGGASSGLPFLNPPAPSEGTAGSGLPFLSPPAPSEGTASSGLPFLNPSCPINLPPTGPSDDAVGAAPAGSVSTPSFAAAPLGSASLPSFAAAPAGSSSIPSLAAAPLGGTDIPSFAAAPSGGTDIPSFAAAPLGSSSTPSFAAAPAGSASLPSFAAAPLGSSSPPS